MHGLGCVVVCVFWLQLLPGGNAFLSFSSSSGLVNREESLGDLSPLDDSTLLSFLSSLSFFLPLPSLLSLSCVSKHLLAALLDEDLWQTLFLSRWGCPLPSEKKDSFSSSLLPLAGLSRNAAGDSSVADAHLLHPITSGCKSVSGGGVQEEPKEKKQLQEQNNSSICPVENDERTGLRDQQEARMAGGGGDETKQRAKKTEEEEEEVWLVGLRHRRGLRSR